MIGASGWKCIIAPKSSVSSAMVARVMPQPGPGNPKNNRVGQSGTSTTPNTSRKRSGSDAPQSRRARDRVSGADETETPGTSDEEPGAPSRRAAPAFRAVTPQNVAGAPP